jgi:hypothetical protein
MILKNNLSLLVIFLPILSFASAVHADPDPITTKPPYVPVYTAKIAVFEVAWIVPQPIGSSSYVLNEITATGTATWNTSVGSGYSDLYGFQNNLTVHLLNAGPEFGLVSPYIANLSSKHAVNYGAFSFRITAWNDNTAELEAIDVKRKISPSWNILPSLLPALPPATGRTQRDQDGLGPGPH